MTNRAASYLRLLGLAGAALLVSACSVMSPAQTLHPYVPADGVLLSMPGLDLRDLAIVADSEGGPGVVIGQAVNETDQAVDVAFSLGGGEGARTTVPAHSGGALSQSSAPVSLSTVPVPPGAMVELTVVTPEAGRNVVQVPVLARDGYYADLPLPSGAPTPSVTPTPSPTGSAQVDPEEEGTHPRG